MSIPDPGRASRALTLVAEQRGKRAAASLASAFADLETVQQRAAVAATLADTLAMSEAENGRLLRDNAMLNQQIGGALDEIDRLRARVQELEQLAIVNGALYRSAEADVTAAMERD